MTHDWLANALDYLPEWFDFQMRQSDQPGCALAIAWDGDVVLDAALGLANIDSGEALTPRHRFRVASHSKTFTAVALLLLRERGKLRLDDPIGRHLDELEPRVGETTIAQLLSHTAGLVRDGTDSRQWMRLRDFKRGDEIRAELADGPSIEPGTRMKYSNHGYALLGMIVEALSGQRYVDWIQREVVDAFGLTETAADGPVPAGTPLAHGHSALLPLGRRVSIPSDAGTRAVAAAGGFVSTAADLARFFASLDPAASRSLLSVASRRELTRPGWPVSGFAAGWTYGSGVIRGSFGETGWRWIGHSGVFPGTLTRTACVLGERLAISVLTNAADGMSTPWLEGVVQVLAACANGGAPDARSGAWRGRWWSPMVAIDLLPLAGRVLVMQPAQLVPTMDATVLVPDGGEADRARVVEASGFGAFGEPAVMQRDADGDVVVLRIGGTHYLREADARVAMAQLADASGTG